MKFRSFCLLCWILATTVGGGLNAAPTAPNSDFQLELSWSIPQNDNWFYFLEPVYYLRGDLIGAHVDSSGSVYISDKISEKLVKFKPGGDVEFAKGQIGEGPGDHQKSGEPLAWDNQYIARLDASIAPKVNVYNPKGDFLHMTKLEMEGVPYRLFWNGEAAIAISTGWEFLDMGGARFSTFLSLINKDGELVRQLPMGQVEMERNTQFPEEDFWYIPYVVVSDDGYTFVQQDLWGGQIDCYDPSLKLIWSIDGGWKPTTRTSEELSQAEKLKTTYMDLSKYNQTVKRMIPRRGGEIWIQPWANYANEGVVELVSFGSKGQKNGEVRISGLPLESGHWVLNGSKLLWMADMDGQNITDSTPAMAVYDLVGPK